MKFIATIAQCAAAQRLPFLVIGGNAVVAYGYARMTHDLDLLVREEDRNAWDTLLKGIGFRTHHSSRVFHMYNSIDAAHPPVDLMFVDAATFVKFEAEMHRRPLEGAEISVPALSHLIALKLHALRGGDAHRRTRDFGDVVELVQINGVNLASPEYQAILDRYADDATRQKLADALPGSFGPESSGL